MLTYMDDKQLTSNAADALHDTVNHLLADGVVTTGIVVGSILLAAHQHLRVEELTVATSADLVNGRGVKIDKQSSGDVLSVARLGEEGLKGAALVDIFGVGIGTAIESEAVLEAVTENGGVSTITGI